jgi:hypothetical protein
MIKMNNQETLAPIQFEDLKTHKVLSLIDEYQSFEVVNLRGKMKEAVIILEGLIERKKMTCRVYTANRSALAAGSLFGGITGIVGLASTLAIAAHNVATLNPDYEIAKHKLDDKLSVNAKNNRISNQIREKKERDNIKKEMANVDDILNFERGGEIK